MSRPAYSLGAKAGGGGQVKSLIVTLKDSVSGAFGDLTRKLQMPETGKIIGIHLNVAARGGTHSTSTVDVVADATSVLAAVFDVAALTPGTPVDKEGSALAAAADSVAKDTVLSVVQTEDGGSSPTWQGVDLQIDYVPLGD